MWVILVGGIVVGMLWAMFHALVLWTKSSSQLRTSGFVFFYPSPIKCNTDRYPLSLLHHMLPATLRGGCAEELSRATQRPSVPVAESPRLVFFFLRTHLVLLPLPFLP